jgi:hypothetical protein
MTVVVPSPTSSSCVRLSSIMLLAAGCATSISRRMAWPSLVRTMPPMGSSSILSMALGPRHDRMMSATVLAAVMLEIWALRPNCRSPPGVCVSVVGVSWEPGRRGRVAEGRQRTHDNHGRLHVGGVAVGWRQGKRRGVDWRRRGVSRYLSAASSSATTQKRRAQAAAASFSAPTPHVTCMEWRSDGAAEQPTPKRARSSYTAARRQRRATDQLKRARPALAIEQFPAFCRPLPLTWLVGQPLSRVQRRAYKNPRLLSNPSSLLHVHLSSCPHSSQSLPLTHTFCLPPLTPHSIASSLISHHPSPITSIYYIYYIHHHCRCLAAGCQPCRRSRDLDLAGRMLDCLLNR